MDIVFKMYGNLEYFAAIWCILCPFGDLMVIWYFSLLFGILNQEKSGNPDVNEENQSSKG
jgi:hypothetical protein